MNQDIIFDIVDFFLQNLLSNQGQSFIEFKLLGEDGIFADSLFVSDVLGEKGFEVFGNFIDHVFVVFVVHFLSKYRSSYIDFLVHSKV